MSESTCPDCGKGMEKGFVPDFAYAAIAQMVWHRGEPEPSRLLGIKTGVKVDKKEFVPITAYRCTGCGVLRFYAQVPDEE